MYINFKIEVCQIQHDQFSINYDKHQKSTFFKKREFKLNNDQNLLLILTINNNKRINNEINYSSKNFNLLCYKINEIYYI